MSEFIINNSHKKKEVEEDLKECLKSRYCSSEDCVSVDAIDGTIASTSANKKNYSSSSMELSDLITKSKNSQLISGDTNIIAGEKKHKQINKTDLSIKSDKTKLMFDDKKTSKKIKLKVAGDMSLCEREEKINDDDEDDDDDYIDSDEDVQNDSSQADDDNNDDDENKGQKSIQPDDDDDDDIDNDDNIDDDDDDDDKNKTNNKQKKEHCQQCGIICRSEYMKIHTRIHTEERPYQCNKCAKTFISKHHCQRHEQSHLYECKVCNKKFSNELNLKNHMKNHSEFNSDESTGSSAKMNACAVCKRVFVHKKNLRSHMKKAHSDMIINEYCDSCDADFTSFTLLQKHKQEIHKQKKFICTDCNKGFSTRGGLNYHLKTHTGIKKFYCSIAECTYQCYQESDLAKHAIKHSKIKAYKCDFKDCNKAYGSNSSLKYHQTIKNHLSTPAVNILNIQDMIDEDEVVDDPETIN